MWRLRILAKVYPVILCREISAKAYFAAYLKILKLPAPAHLSSKALALSLSPKGKMLRLALLIHRGISR
jgi:hypothetical protein